MKSHEGAVNHEVACGGEITAKSYVLNRMPDEHVWCKENRTAISLNPESEIRVLAIWKAPATVCPKCAKASNGFNSLVSKEHVCHEKCVAMEVRYDPCSRGVEAPRCVGGDLALDPGQRRICPQETYPVREPVAITMSIVVREGHNTACRDLKTQIPRLRRSSTSVRGGSHVVEGASIGQQPFDDVPRSSVGAVIDDDDFDMAVAPIGRKSNSRQASTQPIWPPLSRNHHRYFGITHTRRC